jgi:hypothetical protein
VTVDSHAQNLLKNGGFELPGNLPGNSQQTYQNAIGDWQVAGGVEIFQCPGANNSTHGVDFPGINYCSANDGSQYLNLTTGGPAKVWQSVQTEKNALYFVRFMVAAAKDPSLHPQVRVTANDGTSDSGTTLGSTTFSAPASHQPDVSDPKRKPASHASGVRHHDHYAFPGTTHSGRREFRRQRASRGVSIRGQSAFALVRNNLPWPRAGVLHHEKARTRARVKRAWLEPGRAKPAGSQE